MFKKFNYSKLDNTINLSISLNLEDKLDICFVDLHNIIQNDLGYEVFKAIEDIVGVCDIKKVTKFESAEHFYYDNSDNYEYNNYRLDELKNAYEIVFNEAEKQDIKNGIKDIINDDILKSYNLSIDEIIHNTFTRDKYDIDNEDDEFYSKVESYIAMLIADKYYRYFWKENLENYLNEILDNYSDDELKDIIEYIIYEEEQ